jgi:hypothetical protein
LVEYQDVCDRVADSLMIFTDLPKDSVIAKDKAKEMAGY